MLHDFPAGRPDESPPGDEDLAAFLTARWGLHTAALGRSLYIPNEHEPWRLRSAEVLLLDDGLLAVAGFPDLAARPPDHVLFRRGGADQVRAAQVEPSGEQLKAARRQAAPPHPSGMRRRQPRLGYPGSRVSATASIIH